MKTVSFMAGMAAGMVMAVSYTHLRAHETGIPRCTQENGKGCQKDGSLWQTHDEQRAQIRPQTGEKMTCL